MAEENARPDDRPAAPTYELERPTLASARAALEGFYGPHTADIWRTLLFSSGLTGDESDPASLGRLIASMQVGEPLTRLCARSLTVRAAAHERLVAGRLGTGQA